MDGDEAVAGTPGGGHHPDYAVRGKGRGLRPRPRLAASAEAATARGAGRRGRLPADETAELADGHLLHVEEGRRRGGHVCRFVHRVHKFRHPGRRGFVSRAIAGDRSAVTRRLCRGSSAADGARGRAECRCAAVLEAPPRGAGLLGVAGRHSAYATSSRTGIAASSSAGASFTRDQTRYSSPIASRQRSSVPSASQRLA